MIRKREARLLLDNLCGMTMEEIAVREGIHTSRVHQIIVQARRKIGWYPGMSKTQVGAACTRGYHHPDTPGWFNEVLNQEEAQRRMRWDDDDGRDGD